MAFRATRTFPFLMACVVGLFLSGIGMVVPEFYEALWVSWFGLIVFYGGLVGTIVSMFNQGVGHDLRL